MTSRSRWTATSSGTRSGCSRNVVEGSRADSGVVVVMDTRTGELLSLADFPTFDARDPGSASEDDIGARSVSDVYEPGSVEKTLTVAALLDAGMVTPATELTVPGELHLPGATIGDWFDHGRLRLTMAGVIAKSSNIGTVEAAAQMEPRDMWQYLSDFGLGQRDQVGLRGASRGLLPDWAGWSDLTQATIAYGQGVSVTALQMTTAVNTLANGGVRVSPSLVEGRATTRDGVEVGTAHSTARRVVSEGAARDIAQMMEIVVDPDEGTAPLGRDHRLPRGRQDRHRERSASRRLLRRHLHRLVRRLRPGRRPPLHRLLRGPEPAQRRRRRRDGRPGLPRS